MNDMTVFVKTRGGVHDVEVSGKETMGSLYKKAGCAAGLLEGRFKLVWEGEVLDRNGGEQVQELGLVEGCVVHVEAKRTVRLAELKDKNTEVVSELEGLVATDPELVLVVEVGNSPAVEVLSMIRTDLPSGLRFLVVTDSTGCVTSIDAAFLQKCDHLMSVDLILPNVSTIGGYFLAGCNKIETINLNAMTSLSSISGWFMAECKKLETLDLSSMTNLSSIGDGFLMMCVKLEILDLSSMTNLSSIDRWFLYGCKRLETIDLNSMTGLSSVGSSFLTGCEKLETIALRGDTNGVLKAQIPAGVSIRKY